MKIFRRLAIATSFAAIASVTLGAYVRSTGSGLGCPDWPKCHGRWIPPFESAALIEYSHRLAVGLLGILGLAVLGFAWFRLRSQKSIFRPVLLAAGVVLIQAWVGRLVVLEELPANLVALHFFIALILLGLLTLVCVNAYYPRGGAADNTVRRAAISAAAVFVALMAGALVSQSGAAPAFSDWPLMNGSLTPKLRTPQEALHFTHRLLALISGAAVGYSVFRARRDGSPSQVVAIAQIAFGLWGFQVAAGASNVFFGSAPGTVVLHVLLAALLWVTSVALVGVAYRRADSPQVARRKSRSSLGSYLRLTKPRIIELLLITTVPIMVVAEGGVPSVFLVLATLIGGSLAAGSANAINCYLERDIDQVMERTANRPLPRGEIAPAAALRFGVLIGAAGIVWLVLTVNVLAAVLALGAILFYVFVYTLLLKRRTASNIVIGGAAGAAPVLIGWAAVTGRIELPALAAFAIVFYWTPPHFWALSMRYASDYRAAGVPMLPVVQGAATTARRIVAYSIALVATSLLFVPAAHTGPIYLGSALLLGLGFVLGAIRLLRSPGSREAMSLFRFSIAYLTLLFVAMGVDTLVGGDLGMSLL